ncbi:MAG: M55 family metallopeptidase [Clostridia bacterium]
MKFMIALDLEGVAGIVGLPNSSLGDSPKEYEFACREGAREANAAAEALFMAGATEVCLWDNHGTGVNLDPDTVDPRCRLLQGSGAGRWPGLTPDYAGVLLIGYHAMAGTPAAILAHSYDSTVYQSMSIHGENVGEIAIDAHMAGLQGVPVLFVASDDKGVAEAKRIMPWVHCVATKQAYGRNAACSLSPTETARCIKVAVQKAVEDLSSMRTFAFARPLHVCYRMTRLEYAEQAEREAHAQRLDAYTVAWDVAELTELFGKSTW